MDGIKNGAISGNGTGGNAAGCGGEKGNAGHSGSRGYSRYTYCSEAANRWAITGPKTDRQFEGIAAIETALGPEPVSGWQMRDWETLDRAREDQPIEWFVAEDGDGMVLGWGTVGKSDAKPGQWWISVAVLPEKRGQGIGSALLKHAESIAQNGNPTSYGSWCRGYDDYSYAWALRRGYTLYRERTESVLDLTTWDGGRFATALAKFEMRIFDAETVRPHMPGIFRVFVETFTDVPFVTSEWIPPKYDSWVHDWLDVKVDKFFAVAFDGQDVVGVSNLYMPAMEGQGAGIGYTGVLKSHRGRGIAFALKVMATEAGAKAGAKWVRTNNDEDNPAIMSINEKMGFKQVPGPRLLEKNL